MNGAQDLGGQMGFGPVVPEAHEPVFHAPWERRAFALTLAMGATGMWNLDMSRHAREALPPAVYLSASYYEIWLRGLEALLLAQGLIAVDELAAGLSRAPGRPVKRVLTVGAVPTVLAAGSPYDRQVEVPPRFTVGEPVRCRNDHVTTHTRLPRYVRGRSGIVESVHGVFVTPDDNAHGKGENPSWCYGVRFEARELWGAGADPASEVMVDCWERYLEPA